MRDLEWRWADPNGQQRLVREDELRAGLANGAIPPNAPVWRQGWKEWQSAFDVPELSSSALAAANGLVPNIPPPPMFVLEAQNEFEGKNSETPMAGEEPPPPPKYVASDNTYREFRVGPYAQQGRGEPQMESEVKRTLPGPAPPPSNADTAIVMPPTPPPPTAMEALSRAPTPPSAATGGSPITVPPMPPATVTGKPLSTLKLPEVPPEALEKGVRSTLIFGEGGQPPAPLPIVTKDGTSPSSPIVVPAPATSPVAEKNAITRPPPWGEGAARMGSPEEERIGAGDLFEVDDLESDPQPRRSGGRASTPPPVPPKRSIPPVAGQPVATVKMRSLPPPVPVKRSSLIASPTPSSVKLSPESSGSLISDPTPSSSSSPVPAIASDPALKGSTGTLVGMPATKTDASDTVKMDAIPTSSGSGKFDDVDTAPGGEDAGAASGDDGARRNHPTMPPAKRVFSVDAEPSIPKNPSLRDRLDPFVDKIPPLRTLREKRPDAVVPVVALSIGLLGVLGIAGIASLVGTPSDRTVINESNTKASRESATTTAKPVVSAAPSAATVASANVPPPSTPGATNPCTVTGEPTKTNARALVALGVEIAERNGNFGLGYAVSEKEGQAVRILDGLTLKLPPDRKRSASPFGRVIPLVAENGRVKAALDGDIAGVTGHRTATFGTTDFGMKDGQLVAVKKGSDGITPLAPLEGEAPLEALRVAPNGDEWALAFRRSGKVYYARAKNVDGAPSLDGGLKSSEPIGSKVGSPSIAVSKGSLVLVWAEQLESGWNLRLLRSSASGEATTTFMPPAGGPGAPYLSPSVASLGDGRFLLTWTEGQGQSHAVRGITLSETGAALGEPLTLSSADENAGQPQAAVGANGRGVVAFLSGSGKVLDVVLTGVTCGTN